MAAGRPHSFDELPLQIWTALPDGRLDYVNTFTLAYFGNNSARLLDDGWKDVCHSLDLITAGKQWAHCVATGNDYEVRFRLMRGGDRTYRWHVSRAVAIRDANGAIQYWLGSNTDIDQLEREHERALGLAGRAARAE